MAVVDFASASITGRMREVNEDAWVASPGVGVFLVADGCGGMSSGRLAADIAVRAIERILTDPRAADAGIEPLAEAIHVANEQVRAAAIGPQRGMGAALAVLRLAPPWAVSASVGDCRVYRYRVVGGEAGQDVDDRGGALSVLTSDDSLMAAMLKADAPPEQVLEVARTHAHVITKALGTGSSLDVDIGYSLLEPGDLYLVCSDGVWRQLSATDIRASISAAGVSLATRCAHLLKLADDRVGYDNATALLVQC